MLFVKICSQNLIHCRTAKTNEKNLLPILQYIYCAIWNSDACIPTFGAEFYSCIISRLFVYIFVCIHIPGH